MLTLPTQPWVAVAQDDLGADKGRLTGLVPLTVPSR